MLLTALACLGVIFIVEVLAVTIVVAVELRRWDRDDERLARRVADLDDAQLADVGAAHDSQSDSHSPSRS